MQSVHVPHDATLEDQVVLTPMVVLGGLARVLKGANLAMGCTVHQYITIGQYSIVATGAAAIRNVKPFSRYIPGKPISVNEYAIQKYGFAEHAEEIRAYVLAGTRPSAAVVVDIVDHFESCLRDGKKETY